MRRPLTKAEARAFQQRWQRVNAYEEDELRHTPLEVKLQQLYTLLTCAQEPARRA